MNPTVEFRKNGAFQMLISGGDAIDAAMLEAMASAAAANPACLMMTYENGVATITAEIRR